MPLTEDSNPLTEGEFAALMARVGPFAGDRRVVVGVSGGADSMALALLLRRWGKPEAAIVDHGLRAESGAEAALTAARLAALGIPARIWRARIGAGAGLADRARQARYALLSQACREAGCADLLLAHHAQDQAETVQMRQDAGSGPAGQSGMAAIVYDDAARRVRPLLQVPPARLRATLRAAGVLWVEDPTNRDLRTKRARLRSEMGPGSVAEACEAASRYGRLRRATEAAVADELATVCLYPEGFAYAPVPLGPASVSALVWTLSGRPYPPSPRKVGTMRAGTLGGVVVRPAGRFGPGWLLAREPDAVAGPVAAQAGARWDGRFLLEDTVDGATVGALGAEAARFRRHSALPAIVLRGLPALRVGAEVIAVPYLDFPQSAAWPSVNLRFCPARPAVGAAFFVGSS